VTTAFHADESYIADNGEFAVIEVRANEPGYFIVDSYAELADAVQDAAKRNQLEGLTPDRVLDIRASSMAVSPRRWTDARTFA
jgi:hypothetical protein